MPASESHVTKEKGSGKQFHLRNCLKVVAAETHLLFL
jgi:hypothetical protein